MHTTSILNSGDFAFMIGDHTLDLEDIFPGFNEDDRIGIVIHKPCGATGASCLFMAAVTRFYYAYRFRLGNERSMLRLYPDYFLFHVGKLHGSHGQMDVWPPHKEVVVEDDPEQILEAINDRGITRLLVEEIPSTSGKFLRETLSSAEHRILSVLVYSSTGRVSQGDIVCLQSYKAERYVRDALRDSKEKGKLSKDEYEHLLHGRENLVFNGRIMETYRRIELLSAIRMLSTSSSASNTTQRFIAESNPNAVQVLSEFSI
ncbi:hypothetical protein [Ammoniphilus sp. 3BR4]|uniref:hypothetical protein n=1 Tax=Ammoniphilus sp. 3BR4 TaxID=3158265 RepID=UPI0034658CBE